MKHKVAVRKDIYEINKPSELSQVVFFEEGQKGIIVNISSMEIDLINILLYEARKDIIKNNLNLGDDDIFKLTLNLKEVANTLNKYTNGNYEQFIKHLRELKKKEIVINALHKNKTRSTTYTSLIHKIRVISSKNEKRQKVSVVLDGEIINMMINTNKFFTTMFLKIQYSLKLKQSKLLYEILRDYLGKDYKGCESKIIEYDLLLALMNSVSTRYNTFSYFNNDILKKAIKEINEKSDIKVSYEPIKERPDNGRLQVTKIKFMMEKQKCDLIDNQEPELSIEDQIKYNKKKSIAEQRLEQAKEFTTINNEESWIKKTIESITDEFVETQDLIEISKEQIDNINIKDYAGKLSKKYGDIIGLKDYKLIYIFDESKPSITNNAKETLDIINSL